jgi:hypothetical protein
VEAYKPGSVAKDAERLATLSCADWEDDAKTGSILRRRKTSLDNMQCDQNSSDGELALVSAAVRSRPTTTAKFWKSTWLTAPTWPARRGVSGECADTADREENMFRRLFTRENIYALLLCLALIAIIILTTSQSPQWIYQGF